MNNRHLILLDMDNTIVDFDGRFHEMVTSILSAEAIQAWDKSKYWIEDSFPKEHHKSIHSLIKSEGFFLHMAPKEGALEAIQEMLDEGYDVKLCTSPHGGSEYCIDEKKEWVKKYLGQKFVDEMIFSHDKTEVTGHVLIDDRDDIISKGKHTPNWTQILFHANYNQTDDTMPRLTEWSNWKDVLYLILKKDSQ